MRLVSLGLALLALSPAAQACPPPFMTDVPLTADGATLLDDGGVVVETRADGPHRGPQGGLQLTSGGADLAFTHDFIAPRLQVMRPPRGSATIDVVGGYGKVLLTVKQDVSNAAPTPPDVVRLTSTLRRVKSSKRPVVRPDGIQTSSAVLTLAAAPPADTIAVIVFRITKHGPQGVAWWPRGDTVYTYSTGGKGCVPGPSPLHQGEKIAIGFIDGHGRTSPLSKAFSVTAVSHATR